MAIKYNYKTTNRYHFEQRCFRRSDGQHRQAQILGFFLETPEQVRNSRGKRAISVRATEVLLYVFFSSRKIQTVLHMILSLFVYYGKSLFSIFIKSSSLNFLNCFPPAVFVCKKDILVSSFY